jgi:hypothetical protein
MKLRIQGNYIRFRLTQSEVATLAAGARLEESTQFAPAASDFFTYVVEKASQCREVRAWRSDGQIGVTLPDDLVQAWAKTDQVAIEHCQPVGEGAVLHIAVEKDYRCLHSGKDGEENDNFPNPNDAAAPRGQ